MSSVSELFEGSEPKVSSSATFYILLTTTLVLWFVHWWRQQSHFFKLGNSIPGPSGLPFLGNALIALGRTPNGEFVFFYFIVLNVHIKSFVMFRNR